MSDPIFLELDEVLRLHAHQIDTYGGTHGLRDVGLLESALATPRATFGGELLHPSLEEQASAYLFHLVQNHPFLDGNKRIGLAAALVFLELNGREVEPNEDAEVELVLGVARGGVRKATIAMYFVNNTRAARSRPT